MRSDPMSNTNDTSNVRTFLALRTCDPDMTSMNGFRWPESGPVEAPDWDPKPECGGGLHGFKWGEGNGGFADWGPDAKWLVVEVIEGTEVDLGGKVKFPAGNVVFCGDRRGATDYILSHGGMGRAVMGATITGGDHETVVGGYRAIVTGGYCAVVTGGDYATVTGGDHARVTGGYVATVVGGDRSIVTGGHHSRVTGGDFATVTGGVASIVKGGDYATVTGGAAATVIGGQGAIVTGGERATLTGGEGATLVCHWRTYKRRGVASRRVGVGKRGLEPGVPYKCVRGRFVRADQKE
jgi:hypothetical protein